MRHRAAELAKAKAHQKRLQKRSKLVKTVEETNKASADHSSAQDDSTSLENCSMPGKLQKIVKSISQLFMQSQTNKSLHLDSTKDEAHT